MLGKLIVDGTPKDSVPFDNPDERNLIQEVSLKVTQPDSQFPVQVPPLSPLTAHFSFFIMSRSPKFSTPVEVFESQWWTAASSPTRFGAWLREEPVRLSYPGTTRWTAQVSDTLRLQRVGLSDATSEDMCKISAVII